jgi:hypothetical protein
MLEGMGVIDAPQTAIINQFMAEYVLYHPNALCAPSKLWCFVVMLIVQRNYAALVN